MFKNADINILPKGDGRYLSNDEQSRELTRSIRREVGKLSGQWNNLIDRSDHWKHRLDEYMTVSVVSNYILFLSWVVFMRNNVLLAKVLLIKVN